MVISPIASQKILLAAGAAGSAARAARSAGGAPIWPPTPPIARTRPGTAVARLGFDTGCLIDRRGGPRYGPPASSSEGGYAPLGLPRPSLGRAPAQPWRASA